ncbi:MAG: DUF2141 domain-containing protein [Flavobacteriales bacterium]|nr:DUF2141 domain-containing protein [Flavobacteriales bacterium]
MRLILFPMVLLPLICRSQGSLTIDIFLNKPEAGGKLMVAVCPSKEAYVTEKGCITKTLEASGAKLRAFFLTIPPGQHAIKVFHDANANGKLDTNWMGIPNEPYGFGNDARGSFGPPSFEDASVTIGHVPVVTAVKLK